MGSWTHSIIFETATGRYDYGGIFTTIHVIGYLPLRPHCVSIVPDFEGNSVSSFASLRGNMSRLIKQLNQVSESIAPSLGFKTAATSPARLILLIAALPLSNASQLAKITDVDAILIHGQDLKGELQTLHQLADSAGDTPWGVWFETMTGEGIKELSEMGGDFLTFVASKTPAALLGEEIGKVIKIGLPLDDGFIITIDQLPIDAVLLDFSNEEEGITVSQLMDCQRISGLIRKPLMVAVQQTLGDKEILALWEAGANGVVVKVKEEPQPELMRLRQAITALPQTTRKSGGKKAILPHLEVESD